MLSCLLSVSLIFPRIRGYRCATNFSAADCTRLPGAYVSDLNRILETRIVRNETNFYEYFSADGFLSRYIYPIDVVSIEEESYFFIYSRIFHLLLNL